MTSEPSSSSPRRTNWFQVSSYVLIVLLVVETALLINQNRELKATIKSLTVTPVEPLKPGERVEPIRVQTLGGTTTDLAFSGDATRKQLLFIFSTTCPHCEKTLPVWSHITSGIVDNRNVSVIALCTHPLAATQKFASDKKPGFYIVSVEGDTSFSRKYKVPGVPETILLKGDGTVIKTWVGELQSSQVEEIQALLGASQAALR